MPGIFSQAIISGNTVYCSGSLGIDPQTNKLVGPSISERTTQALENLKNVLEAAGSGFDKIVKTTIYITNMEEYAAVNKAYAKAFRGTVVPVSRFSMLGRWDWYSGLVGGGKMGLMIWCGVVG